MKNIVLALSLTVLLTGCASQIMQSYVGQPVMAIIEDYGPPSAAYDTGKGTKTLIWSKRQTMVTGGSSYTTGNVYGYGNSASYFGTTHVTPPTVSNWDCNYVIYAKHTNKKLKNPSGWTVTGFKQPNIMCE